MRIKINDGGRSKYFKAAKVSDCVVRAVAIVTGRDYKEVYDEIRKLIGHTPRNGVFKQDSKKVMSHYGGQWVSCMRVGQGTRTHLADGEIPMDKRLVCCLSKHVTTVIDGVINDTYDPSRGGTRTVYGYWQFN